MPAISVWAAGGARLRPLLFDADGLPADERVEMAGESPGGFTNRLLRSAEARTVRDASAVLVRSPAAAQILAERACVGSERFHVVANGRDEDRFRPSDPAARAEIRSSLGIAADAPLILYVGSIGAKYRFDLVRSFVAAVASRRPDARLLVLTGSPELAKAELGSDRLLSPIVLKVSPEAVPSYIEAADLGLAFIRNSFSMKAVAPIKVAEYLLCGVPVLGTAAVGQTQAALDAGVFLDEGIGPDRAAEWFTNQLLPHREAYRARARSVGVQNFGLGRSIEDYAAAVEAVRAGIS